MGRVFWQNHLFYDFQIAGGIDRGVTPMNHVYYLEALQRACAISSYQKTVAGKRRSLLSMLVEVAPASRIRRR